MGIGEELSTFKNPIDKGEIFRGILGGSLTFIACIVVFSITDDINVLRLMLSAIGGLLVGWFMGFWSELWTRPRTVTITDDGVQMRFFPWRKRKLLKWSDILSLNILLEDPNKYDYKVGRDGILWSRKKRFYKLYWPIANAVREAYKQKMGEYPPITWEPSMKK